MVVSTAQHVLLPAFAAWSFELDCLETKVIGFLLAQLKKAVEVPYMPDNFVQV